MNIDPTPTHSFNRMKYNKIQGLLLGYYSRIMSIKVPYGFLYISLL